jgi:glucokinase
MSRLVIALDVGGTTIKAALLDESCAPRAKITGPTPRAPHDPAHAVLAEVCTVIDRLTAKAGGDEVVAVGVVVPGVVDESAGVARYSKNLGWRDVPFRDLLAERTSMPVAFGHDVRAGGLAEATIGAAQGFSSSAFIPVGTGVAASLVIDGRPYAAGGYAGELGHIDVGTGLACPCGGVGCLETVAACPAIAAAYGSGVTGSDEVVSLAGQGDQRARQVLDGALDALATASATLVTLLAPEALVFGGGLFDAGSAVLDPLAKRLRSKLPFQRQPQVLAAALGHDAGCIGAGLMAFEAAR